MPKRLTVEEVQVKTRLQWNGVAELDITTYVDRCTLARFIDRDFGEWWARPLHVLNGMGRHPQRAVLAMRNANLVSVESVEKRLQCLHDGYVSLKTETYVDTHTKATFVDSRYGEWIAMPYSVLRGGGHPKGKLRKSIKTMRSFNAIQHWKTGDTCYPASGFEHAVLVWLNQNRYDFDWQVQFVTPFVTSKKKQQAVYHVDFYIKDGPFSNTYVEVKGTWSRRKNNDGGYAKWEWFHDAYPNSVLWMRSDLEGLNIIDKSRCYLKKSKVKNNDY